MTTTGEGEQQLKKRRQVFGFQSERKRVDASRQSAKNKTNHSVTSSMSGIEIQPVDGGNKVKVPKDKTNVGRGPLLQITDKKVSRNHATIEINDKGEMVLTPIHTNPCFFKAGGEGDKAILAKDKPKVLSHNDVFGLLPDKLFFRVVYLDQLKNEKKVKKEVKEEEESATDATDEGENDAEATPKKKKSLKYKDMALPLEKTRKLPKWMVGAGKRTAAAGQSKATPTKPAKPKVAANAKVQKKPAPTSSPKRSRRKVRDDYDDDDDEDYEEEVKKAGRRPRAASQRTPKYKEDFVVSGSDLNMSDSSDDEPQKKDDDEDSDFSIDDIDNDSGSDWGAEQKKSSSRSTPSRKGRGRGKRRASASKRRRGSDSDDFLDDSDDDDNYVPRPSKRRAPARKKKQETESEESEESEEEVKPKRKAARRRKRDSDSEESEEEVKPKRKAASRRKRDSDSEESEEEVKPKRKAASRRKRDSDSEESEEEVKPKRKAASRRKRDSEEEEEVVRPKRKAKKKDSEEEEENEEDDAEEETKTKAKPKKKKRKRCMFGKKCYRKNPVHHRDYCHPGDRSFDEIDSEDEEVLRRRAGGALREKDKRSILHRTSDDDGEPNTYDYKDSFLDDGTVPDDASSSAFDPNEEDSDYDPEAEEDLAALKREAKGFLRNKKLQKPVRHK